MIVAADIGRSMQSSGRPNFWIPPESIYETAVPSPTSATRLEPEPATPTRVNTRFNRPPLPLPSPQKQPQRHSNNPPPVHSPSPPPVRHNDRTGKEYNRRERRFEILFHNWSQEVARLQDEHRTVSLKCLNEEETTLAMDNFHRKVQAVMIRYNEEIEALQMSSSEPPSSQSENEEDEDSPAPTPSRNRSFQFHQNDASNEEEEEEDEDEENDSGEDEEEDAGDLDPGGVDPPEHALDDDDDDEDDDEDEERASTPLSEALNVDMSSGDDTDHSARLSRSVKSYQSSEVSQGSLNLNTPPPTEIDEDHRATQRRQARERRKTDELASALPQRLRSETLRGVSPAAVPRPAAMSLFETLSSSPASMSSMQAPQLGSPFSSRRPSRDVPTARPSPIEVNPATIASRIDYLRRQSSTSGSDRSLSRNRQSSPADERSLFKDQFESWKTSIQNQSDALLKKAEKQTEVVKNKFKQEQEEKHQRAQQIFIAEQERILQSFSRDRAGSTGSSASPAVGSHPRSGSFAMPAIGPSVSPSLQRGVPSPAPQSSSPAGRPLHAAVSQTFHYASAPSQSPPQSSPSRTWVPRTAPVSTQPGNRRSTSSEESDEVVDGLMEDDESDAQPTYKGTPPISIPNSARGSFDMGHRRTGSQVYSGTSGASSTPRNPFPQHLRNSSSTTFSSNGTASARSSGGWSGVSGTSTNTTVTSSDTPGSRRGSVGEKTFVAPAGLHGESRKNVNGLTVGTSPPNQPRWTHPSMAGSVDTPASATHSPASTLSRASAAAAMNANSNVNAPPRTTAQQWHSVASASSPSAASAVPPNSNPSTSGSLPRPSIGSLNLAQSPGKSSWKSTATGKPSPPIPIQTKPSGPASNQQRQWSDASFGSVSNASPPLPFGSTSRDSPTLRSSMSNVDLVSSTGSRAALKSRQSTSTFNPTREASVGRESRSKSPSKPVAIPAKSTPAPAKVSSTTTTNAQIMSDVISSSPEPEDTLSKREQKQKAETTGRRAKKKEEADRRKREEDLLRREEEIKRREAELEREKREEKKRREKEAERKREEDLLRREAELRRREEQLKREEAEIAEARRKREAEEEAEAKRQKEAEAASKRQKEEEEEASRRGEEEEEREARHSLDEQSRRQPQPPKESRKRAGKRGVPKRNAEEQRELEAAKERGRLAEEERLEEETRLEELRREEALEEERRGEEARAEEQRRKEAKRREREEARLAAERREREESRKREDARLAAERREQEIRKRDEARLAVEQKRLEEEREAERVEQMMREQRKAELYRQEQEALEEARQRQRAKEEKRIAEERERRGYMRHDDDNRRQAWNRQQEEEKRLEEERRAQEARIREQNNRMTEMFQARDRSNQMNNNMPKRFADAWEAYDEKWKGLITQAQTGGRPSLTFATVPWPLLNPPSGPEAITRNAVGAFILSQWHSKGKTPRDRIRDALLRWHPDRFESRYLGWAPEGDERENVRIGVGNVTRSLNELSTKEGPGAAL